MLTDIQMQMKYVSWELFLFHEIDVCIDCLSLSRYIYIYIYICLFHVFIEGACTFWAMSVEAASVWEASHAVLGPRIVENRERSRAGGLQTARAKMRVPKAWS